MTSPLASDESLVDGLRAGRRDAFERLYADYNAAIYNLCARILNDREEAKDLTQEVFIKAFSQLPEPGAQPLKLRPWIYRVATNACFNQLRSRRRLDGGGDAGLEHAASGVDEFERAQTVALVEQSLGEMNERYRTTLVLKDLQGLPPEEIAEVMEVSRPTADVLVHRARASFKTVFTKLAGEGATAPAALGLVLVPLSLPAALHAMPPLPASLATTVHAPGAHAPLAPTHHGVPMPDLSSAAGPAGAGLLTKIGAALSTKIGITAAAATMVVGGVVAVHEMRSHSADQATASGMQQAGQASRWKPASAKWMRHHNRWSKYSHWRGRGWPMNSHHGHWEHHAASWSWHESSHSGSGSGLSSASHDSGDSHSSTWSGSHDSSMDTSSSAHDSGTSTLSGSHDGGDMSSSHDGGSSGGW